MNPKPKINKAFSSRSRKKNYLLIASENKIKISYQLYRFVLLLFYLVELCAIFFFFFNKY